MTCRDLISFAEDMEAQADEMFRCARQLKWQAERIRAEVKAAMEAEDAVRDSRLSQLR